MEPGTATQPTDHVNPAASAEPVILTTTLLQEVITRVVESLPNGEQCGAGMGADFALALAVAFRKRSLEHKIRFGLRNGCDPSDDSGEQFSTLLSRFVLQALGTSWDSDGPEARPRWEAKLKIEAATRIRFTWKNIKEPEETVGGINKLIQIHGENPIDLPVFEAILASIEAILPVHCIIPIEEEEPMPSTSIPETCELTQEYNDIQPTPENNDGVRDARL